MGPRKTRAFCVILIESRLGLLGVGCVRRSASPRRQACVGPKVKDASLEREKKKNESIKPEQLAGIGNGDVRRRAGGAVDCRRVAAVKVISRKQPLSGGSEGGVQRMELA